MGYFHHYNVWLVILIYVFQLDLLVAEKLFLDFQHFTSGMITQHKSNFLNNEALAVLAVKNNFHLFHQNVPMKLKSQVDNFVALIQNENFPCLNEVSVYV